MYNGVTSHAPVSKIRVLKTMAAKLRLSRNMLRMSPANGAGDAAGDRCGMMLRGTLICMRVCRPIMAAAKPTRIQMIW